METFVFLLTQRLNNARERHIAQNNIGQATIEFALTMVLFLGFMMFFLQLCLVLSFGSYVHYATFMAARAYLAAGGGGSDQADRAKHVIASMLKKSPSLARVDKFPMIAKGLGGTNDDVPGLSVGPGPQYVKGNIAFSWMMGVQYTFTSRLFLLPLAGPGGTNHQSKPNSIVLTSESWLGREPTLEDCEAELKKYKGLFDNGC